MSSKVKSLLIIATGGGALFSAYQLYTGNAKFYSSIAMPALQVMTTPETAHRMAILSLKWGFYPRQKCEYARLRTTAFGKDFVNPVGLAAGFDKHIDAIGSLTEMGFGFLEFGSITPEPQPGNSKPRVFRLREDSAVINRYGFNSEGHEKALERLMKWTSHEHEKEIVVGINLGKNKSTTDPSCDFVKGVESFGLHADYLVINVSSPNTPGLRNSQAKEELSTIIRKVVEARDKIERKEKPPIFIKIAPDLTEMDKIDIARVVTAEHSGVSGLVVCNTTIARPSTLRSPYRNEMGGLSGAPLKDVSTQLIRDMFRLTGGKCVIIGVGGIFSGRDAYDKIRAGASLVQIYTSLIYRGPPVVNQIKQELDALLERDGYNSVSEAVGADFLTEK